MVAAVVIARPKDAAAAMDDDEKGMKRHRDRVDERSPDAKRCRRDDSHCYRVSSSSASRKRKRDEVRGCSRRDDRRRRPRYLSPSRGSSTRRSHVRRTPKRRDLDERAQGSKRRRRSRSPVPSEPKTQQPAVIPSVSAKAQSLTLPAAPCPRVACAAALADIQPPLQDQTEQFEETELRRRETARKREEARREMDKVTQSVYFNDPFLWLPDILKR